MNNCVHCGAPLVGKLTVYLTDVRLADNGWIESFESATNLYQTGHAEYGDFRFVLGKLVDIATHNNLTLTCENGHACEWKAVLNEAAWE